MGFFSYLRATACAQFYLNIQRTLSSYTFLELFLLILSMKHGKAYWLNIFLSQKKQTKKKNQTIVYCSFLFLFCALVLFLRRKNVFSWKYCRVTLFFLLSWPRSVIKGLITEGFKFKIGLSSLFKEEKKNKSNIIQRPNCTGFRLCRALTKSHPCFLIQPCARCCTFNLVFTNTQILKRLISSKIY